MQIAVLLSMILILVFWITRACRPRLMGFACLRAGGVAKDKIVKIERKLGNGIDSISQNFLREIRIFNKMRLVMPCRHGAPVMYSQFLGRLVLDPRWVVRSKDGIARLLYMCAAVNLYANLDDELVRRQLLKNCLYVFGSRDNIKKTRKVTHSQRKFHTHRQPRFKYIGGQFILARNRIDKPSYTFYNSRKHFADKLMPVQCFECKGLGGKFTHFVSRDKFAYNLTHTSDTFYAVGEGKAVGLYVPNKVAFGSSICEKTNDLNIYATTDSGRYYIIHGKSKQEITGIVGEIKRKRGQLDYLLTTDEAREIAQVETLFAQGWASRFVRGDGLKDKYTTACKYVPTLYLPTLVYSIDQPDDFFAVVDNFPIFKKIAATGNSINVVFMYSSMRDDIHEIIKTFADKQEAKSLISSGVFLFFIDRVKAMDKAVNYLSLMSQVPKKSKIRAKKNNKKVETTTHIGTSFPLTHTTYVRNTVKSMQTAHIRIPLNVGHELHGIQVPMPSICRRVGGNLHVTNVKTGRSASYKLPIGATVIDEFGRVIEDIEIACECVFVTCAVKLAPFEEKVFKIIKGEGGLSRTERKQTFLGNLENIQIKGDARLQRLFTLGLTDTTDEKLTTSLKEAIRDFNPSVFFDLLGCCDLLASDIYALVIERVVGIKLLRGKIQLAPCVAITGNFELCFTYKGTPYNFAVKSKGSGFIVNYGDTEYKNFLQVAVK